MASHVIAWLRVATGLVPETGFVSQRVHQPRLALRQPPDLLPPLVREHLVRLPGMLCQQGLDLARQEISEPQRFGPNVECAATRDDGVFGPGPNSVVAHVTHAAQNYALGKPPGAVRVTGPELTQYRQQRVAHQSVDLVDHEHQRLGIGFAPSRQRLPQRVVGACCFQNPRPNFCHEQVVQRVARRPRQGAEDRSHTLSNIFTRRLTAFDVDVHATVLPAEV